MSRQRSAHILILRWRIEARYPVSGICEKNLFLGTVVSWLCAGHKKMTGSQLSSEKISKKDVPRPGIEPGSPAHWSARMWWQARIIPLNHRGRYRIWKFFAIYILYQNLYRYSRSSHGSHTPKVGSMSATVPLEGVLKALSAMEDIMVALSTSVVRNSLWLRRLGFSAEILIVQYYCRLTALARNHRRTNKINGNGLSSSTKRLDDSRYIKLFCA